MIPTINMPLTALLDQLTTLLEDLTDEEYTEKIALLSGASIGQHTRHIIEFFLELHKGYATGYVNYDERQRDYAIETQRSCAIDRLQDIAVFITLPDKALMLEADYDDGTGMPCRVTTNYHRELVYNMEHAIHHMALLRIGVNSISTIALPENFGVASSTINYRKACAR